MRARWHLNPELTKAFFRGLHASSGCSLEEFRRKLGCRRTPATFHRLVTQATPQWEYDDFKRTVPELAQYLEVTPPDLSRFLAGADSNPAAVLSELATARYIRLTEHNVREAAAELNVVRSRHSRVMLFAGPFFPELWPQSLIENLTDDFSRSRGLEEENKDLIAELWRALARRLRSKYLKLNPKRPKVEFFLDFDWLNSVTGIYDLYGFAEGEINELPETIYHDEILSGRSQVFLCKRCRHVSMLQDVYAFHMSHPILLRFCSNSLKLPKIRRCEKCEALRRNSPVGFLTGETRLVLIDDAVAHIYHPLTTAVAVVEPAACTPELRPLAQTLISKIRSLFEAERVDALAFAEAPLGKQLIDDLKQFDETRRRDRITSWVKRRRPNRRAMRALTDLGR